MGACGERDGRQLVRQRRQLDVEEAQKKEDKDGKKECASSDHEGGASLKSAKKMNVLNIILAFQREIFFFQKDGKNNVLHFGVATINRTFISKNGRNR